MILKVIGFIVIVAVVFILVGYLVERFCEDFFHLQKGIDTDDKKPAKKGVQPNTNKDQTKRLRGRRPLK